ncbi:hypothetical protein SmJEL517_g06005 [Synchytrium microbalum]|uniref:Autophagy-related protein 16 domain-containing protein n=1 Tax=Synchytrium microbalum TaxID=1806994 RepID=A0A507BT11_9FUNG|nr:uncharacterized protein SmJEL517_g06005 [Synchytrium microbalum]TPX30451.1 hypothetical protein SmJEL517_g06005 [Synchytrium microbalum]
MDPIDLSVKTQRDWDSGKHAVNQLQHETLLMSGIYALYCINYGIHALERNFTVLGRKPLGSAFVTALPLNWPSSPKTPSWPGKNLFTIGYGQIAPTADPPEELVLLSPTPEKPPLYLSTPSSTTRRKASSQRNKQRTTGDDDATSRRSSSRSKSRESNSIKSNVTRNSSSSTLVNDEEIATLTEAELSSLPETSTPQITFYQGFRAVYPQLAATQTTSRTSIKRSSNNIQSSSTETGSMVHMRYEKMQVHETMELHYPTNATAASTSSHDATYVAPENIRVHSVSIHNVSRLFTELLNERDLILHECEKLETERGSYTDQLRQIEDMLTELNRRKGEVIQRLRQVADREEKVNELLEDLDARVASVGDESARFERKIRSIKGDSAALDVDATPRTLPNTCLKTLFGHEDTVECLDFDIPFGTLASGSADRTIRIWDLSSHRCSAVLSGHTGWVRSVQIRNQTLMSGSGDHTIRQWDLSLIPPLSPVINVTSSLHHKHEPAPIDSEVVCTRVFRGHAGGVGCLAFDDRQMVSGSTDSTIRVWDLNTGDTTQILRTEKWVEGVSMNKMDAMVVGHGARESLNYPPATVDIFTDKPKDDGFMLYNVGGHVAALQFVEFALAAGYGDGLVRLWDLRSGKCHRELGAAVGGHTGAITTLKFDERCVVTGGVDKTVKIWDLRIGDVLETIPFDTCINAVAFDTWKIVVATSSKDISIYNRSTSSIRILDQESSYSPDTDQQSIVTKYGQTPPMHGGHSKSVRCLSLVDDMLCSGGADDVVKVWRMGKFGSSLI